MKRREFITLIGGAAASPFVARAQQPKVKRLAMVHPSDPVAFMVASHFRGWSVFFDELGRAGFEEGKSLIVERHSALANFDRYFRLPREVVDTRPDAILTWEPGLAILLKALTTTIPIVTTTIDPVALGIVSNIARPGGNVTGTVIDGGIEIWGKRFGLFKEAVPKLTNISIILATLSYWEQPIGLAVRQAAKVANIALNGIGFDDAGKIDKAEYDRVFAAFEQNRPDAIMVAEDPVHLLNAVAIIELAAKNRLPAMYTWRDFVDLGGLMSYSFDVEEISRSTAQQVIRVLNGTNPGDIPFIQATRLELALNLKTAKSLGIEFPATLLGSADLVVE